MSIRPSRDFLQRRFQRRQNRALPGADPRRRDRAGDRPDQGRPRRSGALSGPAAHHRPGRRGAGGRCTWTGCCGQAGPWCGRGRTLCFLGSSGVGKSTLSAALTGRALATAAIREDDAKGRHTTTARLLMPVVGGGWLIDTPGMRELRLADVAEGIDAAFSDLAETARLCRFSDCRHESEPAAPSVRGSMRARSTRTDCAAAETSARGQLEQPSPSCAPGRGNSGA